MICKFIIIRKYTDSYLGSSYLNVPFIFPEKINHYGMAQTLLDGNMNEIHSAGFCKCTDNGFTVWGSGDTIGYGTKYDSAEILNKWFFNTNQYYSHSS